jgi:hypothetical protein
MMMVGWASWRAACPYGYHSFPCLTSLLFEQHSRGSPSSTVGAELVLLVLLIVLPVAKRKRMEMAAEVHLLLLGDGGNDQ